MQRLFASPNGRCDLELNSGQQKGEVDTSLFCVQRKEVLMPRYISELCAKASRATKALEDIAISLKVIALCLSKDEGR